MRILDLGRLAAKIGVGMVLAMACGGQAATGDGSESHFAHCHVDADCTDDGTLCVAGLCKVRVTTLPSDGGAPPGSECRVDSATTGPFPVTFRFLNPSNAPVGISLGGQCGPQYRVTSCSDDYTEALTLHAQCGATCPEVPQCVSGACNDEPTGVSNAVTDEWDGVRYTGRPGPMGTCNERIVASAGRYRVQVPVYPAVLPRQPTGGADWTPLSTVSVDFTLPAPGNVVNVFVDRGTLQAGIDAGTAVPEGCRPVAARRFDVANGCYLPVAEVPGLCMFEPDPKEALTGIDEIVCLAAPDGTRYVAAKSFSECLAGPGWTTEPSGVGNGWIVRSNEGLARCQQSTADYVGGDAGFLEDTACEAAIGLGHAYLNPKDLSFGFSGVDASSDAVECAPGTP